MSEKGYMPGTGYVVRIDHCKESFVFHSVSFVSGSSFTMHISGVSVSTERVAFILNCDLSSVIQKISIKLVKLMEFFARVRRSDER